MNSFISNLKGEDKGLNTKLQNGQFSKKRGADTVNGIEEPSAKKQRKSAKNHVLVKDQVNRLLISELFVGLPLAFEPTVLISSFLCLYQPFCCCVVLFLS